MGTLINRPVEKFNLTLRTLVWNAQPVCRHIGSQGARALFGYGEMESTWQGLEF